MPHNRVPLLGLVLLTLIISAFIATRLSSGQAPQTSKPPMKMKLLRDKPHMKYLPNESEIANFKKQLQENERQLEDSIPKHVPVKIKIKKEKEAGFKDLKNEQWAREFELEVTNTGTKPIYALDLYVITDVKAAAGFRIVFPLTYGRAELGDLRTKAEPTDIPIQPGETVSLKIHPGQLDAWDVARRRENRPSPKRLKVDFQFLSFGDGSGYWGTDGLALPHAIPEQGNAQACPPQTNIFGWKDAPPGSLSSKLLTVNLPAGTWPVNFLSDAGPEITFSSSPWVQTCCSGSNCSALIPWKGNVCANCPQQNRPSITTCGDPAGSCRTTVSDYIECFLPKNNEPYACQTIEVLPCGAPPTPSPAPSPSPSPSPSPTPTPCPLALPSECPGGVPRDPCTNPDPPPPSGGPSSNPDGCPFGYEVSGSSCCIPIACPQPTPTPPSCPEGEISQFYGPPACQWSDCFTPFPDPGATPTPQYAQACVDYYWVWYVSYDGGVTWQPTGQVEYAGCFHLD
jgi:hypothetical protein